MQCKYFDQCKFINKMKAKNATVANMFISKYCNNEFQHCAIFIIAEKKSINEVPENILPYNLKKAEGI